MPRTKLQITVAIVILGVIAAYALYSKAPDITSGCTGGIIALGMKLLEHTTTPPTNNLTPPAPTAPTAPDESVSSGGKK